MVALVESSSFFGSPFWEGSNCELAQNALASVESLFGRDVRLSVQFLLNDCSDSKFFELWASLVKFLSQVDEQRMCSHCYRRICWSSFTMLFE